ncbi:MAG: metal-dependent hydrolase, partial [Candidatus Limnocylindria bacterium]
AISRSSGDRWPAIATLVVVGAAVAPDFDLLLDLNHRGPTHSVGFAAFLGLACFVVARAMGFRLAGRLGTLVALAVLSHIALDLATAHSPVAALWPLSRREFTLPFLLLPSAPTDEGLLSQRGVVLLLAEIAWSGAAILIGILVGKGRTASRMS